jgi:hypothetical protein
LQTLRRVIVEPDSAAGRSQIQAWIERLGGRRARHRPSAERVLQHNCRLTADSPHRATAQRQHLSKKLRGWAADLRALANETVDWTQGVVIMETRNVGNSPARGRWSDLAAITFGARVDLPGTRRVVDRALDAGITFFDTADSYGNRGGSETCLGEALGERRQRTLATKFASPMDDTDAEMRQPPLHHSRRSEPAPAQDRLIDLYRCTGRIR